MADRDEQQSSGCSACDQMGQTPTPEHLAGVARFEARQQAATGDHQPSDGRWGPRCSPCEQPWPCRAALEAENARLRALTTTLLEWKVCAKHADQVAVATARDRQWQRNNEFPWLGWQLCEGCLHDDLAAFISGNPDATTLATKLKEARDGALTAALRLGRLRGAVDDLLRRSPMFVTISPTGDIEICQFCDGANDHLTGCPWVALKRAQEREASS